MTQWKHTVFVISKEEALKLIEDMKLETGSSFTKNGSGKDYSEYMAKTGYFVDYGREALINIEDRKNEKGEVVSRYFVNAKIEAFGIERHDMGLTKKEVDRAKAYIEKFKSIVNKEYDIDGIDELDRCLDGN